VREKEHEAEEEISMKSVVRVSIALS